MRRGMGISEFELGARLGLSQPRISQIERAEVDGSLRLGTLERAAAALLCELRYALIPRESLANLAYELATFQRPGEKSRGPDGPTP